jgi:hypothetical protein
MLPPLILVTPHPHGYLAEVPGISEVKVSAPTVRAALLAVEEAYRWWRELHDYHDPARPPNRE